MRSFLEQKRRAGREAMGNNLGWVIYEITSTRVGLDKEARICETAAAGIQSQFGTNDGKGRKQRYE